jgi:NADH dehydrogenase (ubiquinone) Fe-S protein 1
MRKKINNKISLISYLIANGISIPHYCYHNNLSIAGNCRICIVEIKNSMKPVVSCATNAGVILQNNSIYHNSVLVTKARENILEFLLLNHPLDCPICDQGGECDLQDQSIFFGFTKRRFYKFKRVVHDKEIGPIVKTVMTRCIHCTRCVRFINEIVGNEDLGIFGRGNFSEIGTYVNKIMATELSGNIIDLCPVGALTFKNFPFELRGWDIQKFESIDPTDGFALNTRVYINKNKIIRIEPSCKDNKTHTWLSDKSRQFFDSIFDDNQASNTKNKNLILSKNSWKKSLKKLFQTIYLFEHCKLKTNKNYFITFVIENVSLEILSLLKILEQKYAFIKLRRSEALKTNNNLEFYSQINSSAHSTQLNSSTLALIINSDLRYETYNLNLLLRQRFLKGSFKSLVVGSYTNTTFPNIFIGSSLNILKKISEGNNFTCQDLKTSINPILIYNNELLKRADGKKSLKTIETCSNFFGTNQNWNGINCIHSNLNGVGMSFIANISGFKEKDFFQCSSLYFINIDMQKESNLKKVIETKLLNYKLRKSRTHFNLTRLFFDQTSQTTTNQNFKNLIGNSLYFYLPIKMFYENQETFINTLGTIKQTNKLITHTKKRESWKIIRNLVTNFNSNYVSFNFKNDSFLFFNGINYKSFKYFTNLQFQAINKLDTANLFLLSKNKPFFILKNSTIFRNEVCKIKNSKMKYWLDDFFIGGRDEFSKDSRVMINCSVNLRNQATNFF